MATDRPLHAVIITPAYTHVSPRTLAAVQASGLPFLPLYEHSDLPRVRSVLVEMALGRPAERIIFLDADTVPDPGVLLRLADDPYVTPGRAVWGLYPLRDGARWSVDPKAPEQAERDIRDGVRFPIRKGGLGLACVHRMSLLRAGDILPHIEEQGGAVRWRPFCVPFYRIGPLDKGSATYHADDGSLCARLRETETELWCDPTARAGHAVATVLREPRA